MHKLDTQRNKVPRIKQFVLLVELGEGKPIGQAAKACGLTHGATSRMLQALEREAGAALFVRGQRGVTPTAFGEIFIRRARAVLDNLDRMAADVSDLYHGRAGVLRVGAATWVSAARLSRAICALKARYPVLAVEASVARDELLAERLRRRELDLVVAGPPADQQARRAFHYHAIGEQCFAIVARRGHPLHRAGAGDWSRFGWAWGLEGGPDLATVTAVLEKAGLWDTDQVTRVGDILTAASLVIHSDMLTVVPAGSIDPLLAAGKLVELAHGLALPRLACGCLTAVGLPPRKPLDALAGLLATG